MYISYSCSVIVTADMSCSSHWVFLSWDSSIAGIALQVWEWRSPPDFSNKVKYNSVGQSSKQERCTHSGLFSLFVTGWQPKHKTALHFYFLKFIFLLIYSVFLLDIPTSKFPQSVSFFMSVNGHIPSWIQILMNISVVFRKLKISHSLSPFVNNKWYTFIYSMSLLWGWNSERCCKMNVNDALWSCTCDPTNAKIFVIIRFPHCC